MSNIRLRLHKDSKFANFSLKLQNGGILTGISCIPTRTQCTPASIPLIVAVHGGSCTAHNYDIDPSHSASLYATALGIPFVSINRPGYEGTTSILPTDNFHLDTGRWLHEFIFPAIWNEFGVPMGCSALVVLCHSMAVPQVVISSAHLSDQHSSIVPTYPLAGIILSGYGCRFHPERNAFLTLLPVEDYPLMINYPVDVKSELMLGVRDLALCDDSMYSMIESQNVPMTREELVSGIGWFPQPEVMREYCAKVTVPVLYGLGQDDFLWHGSMEHVDEFKKLFPNSPSFEGSLVRGAPHAIEWSKAGQGWYVKCFGWAAQVVAEFELKK
jgi:pimeloyl-ACP methyl ester carboxylesterase